MDAKDPCISGDALLQAEIATAHASRLCLLAIPGLTREEAWRIFADTDGLNRAIGNPDVLLTNVPVEDGVARRIITTKATPSVTYEEESYQWEAGRWVGGRRFFSEGPLARFCFLFSVSPAPDGAMAHIHVGMWGRGAEGHSAARDAADALSSGLAALSTELSAIASSPDRRLAAVRRGSHEPDRAQLVLLEKVLLDSGEQRDVVRELTHLVESKPDNDLAHMAPLELARAWHLPAETVTGAFIRATRLGLLESRWSVACPSCRGLKGGTDDVSALGAAPIHCADCNIRFDADPTRNMVMTFAPAKALRPVDETFACVGAPTRTPHIHALAYVDGGASLVVAHAAEAGMFLYCPELDASCELAGTGVYSLSGGALQRIGDADGVVVRNTTARRVRVRVEDRNAPDALRASDVLASARFRELFAADEWDFLNAMVGAWRATFGLRALRAATNHVESRHFDVVIIGAGPGGEACALRAAQLGRTVAVVEASATFGGPSGLVSKAMREAARKVVAWSSTESSPSSTSSQPAPLGPVFERRFRLLKGYVTSLQMQDVLSRMARAGVRLFHGSATLANGGVEVRADAHLDAPLRLTADNVVLATGSRALRPHGVPFDDHHVIDADQLACLEVLPARLCVVGAGVIACEVATTLAALGVRVTLVGQRRPFAFLDAELATLAIAAMERAGIRVVIGRMKEIVHDPRGPVVALDDGTLIDADVVLYAEGRAPSTAGLGCAQAGVALDERGRVLVDEQNHTSQQGADGGPRIFAVGDVVGPPGLASAATRQGHDVADEICGIAPSRRAALVPLSLWTLPEIGAVGMTEEQARALGTNVVVGKARFGDSPRGILSGDRDGWLKLVAEGGSGKLLGVHILGEDACELIHYGRALVESGALLQDVARAGFSAMTLHGLYQAAAEAALQEQQHLPWTGAAVADA